MAGTYDLILLGPIESGLFYDCVAERLKTLVHNGAGLVCTGLPAKMVSVAGQKQPVADDAFAKELLAAPVAAPPAFLTAGTPFASLPGFHLDAKSADQGYGKVATLYQYGQGRVLRLNLGSGYGLFANAEDANDLHYEYYQSFAIKAMLWAAGKESPVQFDAFPTEQTATHAATGSGEFTFTLHGLGGQPGAVALAVRPSDPVRRLAQAPIARRGVEQGAAALQPVFATNKTVAGDGPVTFSLPALPAGDYFVDATVTRDGETLNWATAHLTVTSTPSLGAVQLLTPVIDVADGKSAEVKAHITLNGAAAGALQLRVMLLDNWQRELLSPLLKAVPPHTEALDVTLPVAKFATTLGTVLVELRQGGDLLDVAAGHFTTIRRDWDRFGLYGFYSPNGWKDHAIRVYTRELAGMGLDAWRGNEVSPELLQVADTVAMPTYQGMPRTAVNVSPEYLQKVRDATAGMVKSFAPYDPVVYTTGDEIDYGGGDEQQDRIADLRQVLQKKYGTIQQLNERWETNYASFDEVYPLTAGAISDADKGKLIAESEYFAKANTSLNFSRFIDQWVNDYRVFNDCNRLAHDVIKGLDPHARVGVDSPMWEFSRTGHDWYSHMKNFEMFFPYGREGETQPYEEARSFARPGSYLGLSYGGYMYNAFARREELTDVEWQRWRLWYGLLRGFTGVLWYTLSPGVNEGNIGPGFAPYPTFIEASQQIDRIRRGYYTLFTRMSRDYGPIAIRDSISARLTTSCLPDMGYEQAFNDHMLLQILRNSVGVNYTYVADEQIQHGGLKHYKVLLLPTQTAIGQAEAAEIRKFLEDGGLVIADVRPGLLDDGGKWDDANTVSALFGLSWEKTLGRKMVTSAVNGDFEGMAFANPSRQFPVDPARASPRRQSRIDHRRRAARHQQRRGQRRGCLSEYPVQQLPGISDALLHVYV